MSVCLSVSYIAENARPNFTQVPVHVVCVRGSVILVWRCSMLCTLLPVLWTTGEDVDVDRNKSHLSLIHI